MIEIADIQDGLDVPLKTLQEPNQLASFDSRGTMCNSKEIFSDEPKIIGNRGHRKLRNTVMKSHTEKNSAPLTTVYLDYSKGKRVQESVRFSSAQLDASPKPYTQPTIAAVTEISTNFKAKTQAETANLDISIDSFDIARPRQDSTSKYRTLKSPQKSRTSAVKTASRKRRARARGSR